MNKTVKILALGVILAVTSNLTIANETVKKPITIEEMEIQLANLGAEIAREKAKIYQKEALLYEMKLDLMKKKTESKK